MKNMLYVAFIVAALTGMTNASAQAAGAKRGGVCIGPFRGADSVLQCEHIGKVTIKQIYEKGFRVVTVYTPFYNGEKLVVTNYTMIIEEQK